MLYYYFPNNDLFHYSFYKLYFIILVSNEENTQRILFQNCKFLTRAIALLSSTTNKEKQPHQIMNYGIILKCLNALRLYYQYVLLLCNDIHDKKILSMFYLKHYLDSHESWKSVQDLLIGITLEQQTNNGITVPTNADVQDNIPQDKEETKTSMIDLGSPYAIDLGFDVEKLLQLDRTKIQNDGEEQDDVEEEKEERNHGKKKKKKNKKKGKNKK